MIDELISINQSISHVQTIFPVVHVLEVNIEVVPMSNNKQHSEKNSSETMQTNTRTIRDSNNFI